MPDDPEIMRGMDSDTIDLIDLDPSFNSNRKSGWIIFKIPQ